ncbi:hypothetical protein BC793_101435 [Actinoplanes xinjiangensis]|uniref:Uncharacterized protein n=1 Tax=Actinoplanes xinjiangensis TaxID=512350 RepID=A0A316FXM3_9ACTN|nr:hypothetical protein BC793_101435 [Actinoplanes xinjiangensis]
MSGACLGGRDAGWGCGVSAGWAALNCDAFGEGNGGMVWASPPCGAGMAGGAKLAARSGGVDGGTAPNVPGTGGSCDAAACDAGRAERVNRGASRGLFCWL